jgi:flavin reductase (DIM6/NTAB) family NADH-FMN oxidoreductase RutF
VDTAGPFGTLTAALDYPMFVVTVAEGRRRAGCLVGFTTQCSIEPPRFFVCLSRNNHTYRVAKQADVLALHLLGRHQRDLADLFGHETGDETDKFTRCRWTPGRAGTPLLADCPNRFVARIVDRVDVGDHLGLVVEPVEGWAGDLGALLTFQQVRDLEPGHPA